MKLGEVLHLREALQEAGLQVRRGQVAQQLAEDILEAPAMLAVHLGDDDALSLQTRADLGHDRRLPGPAQPEQSMALPAQYPVA
jgi:hypothetical protein